METENEVWALIDLMGHAQTAGRISRPGVWGGLLQVDVPNGEEYRTEYYGLGAIYSVKVVSEEIARAFVRPMIEARAYDAPIVTREQYEADINKLIRQNSELSRTISELQKRLISISALPEPEEQIEQGSELNQIPGDIAARDTF